MKNIAFAAIIVIILASCSSTDETINTQPTTTEPMYFPPIGSNVWKTKTIGSLGWNTAAVQPLKDFLSTKNTKSFMILINGKIVIEEYFNGHTSTANWYWASAGKTLTAIITGIAQQEGLININNRVSQYLGANWTSAPPAKENIITCKHLLTMTSGLEDIANGDAVDPASLTYTADAGTRWAYHNAYVKLQDVVAQASRQSWSSYFNAKLKNPIGMDGTWLTTGNNVVYYSSTRAMARFGLLTLNKGNWSGTQIINTNYCAEATNTSQNINLSYGYLWWLNGKSSYRLPQTQIQINGNLIATAPADMYCALGKNDQKIYVVPSKNMVVIRMGEAADSPNLALSGFDEELWTKIKALYN